jgi:UDP-glucose 4-epimerase
VDTITIGGGQHARGPQAFQGASPSGCEDTSEMSTVLVTGGAGYIGSHTSLVLADAGHRVLVLDNLSNSHAEAVARISRLTCGEVVLLQGDVRDRSLLDRVFAAESVSAVVHFAAKKAVGESVSDPLPYYDTNVAGTISLLQAMAAHGVRTFVFSSSATVYGDPKQVPVDESADASSPTSPYGRTKVAIEGILRDLAASDNRWSIAMLRYFNAVGAHESGTMGEDPKGTPQNLAPVLAQVAVGRLPQLTVFGNDYPTPDGTCIRDYIHVMDLAEGHLCALRCMETRRGTHAWNLGTGQGYSVLEVMRAFEAASGGEVPFRFAPKRAGDVAACYADPSSARRDLGWSAQRDLATMMTDVWRWQSNNPNGYR